MIVGLHLVADWAVTDFSIGIEIPCVVSLTSRLLFRVALTLISCSLDYVEDFKRFIPAGWLLYYTDQERAHVN